MAEPFLSEIRLMSFSFAPKGWALCNGQLLPINQNQALFSILGVQYGGNGVTNFALPNLQGRVPVHQSSAHPVGQSAGEAAHTLTINEMPAHVHLGNAHTQPQAAPGGVSPAGALQASGSQPLYGSTPNAAMAANPMSSTGGNQPHENQAPYLVVNMMIALVGVFPSRG